METCQQLHDIGGVASRTDVVPPNSVHTHSVLSRSPRSGADDNMDAHVEVAYLKNIFNNLPVAVIMLDGYGYVRYSNNKAIEFFGLPILGVLWRNLIERCFSPDSKDDAVLLKDGRVVKLEISPLDDKCGQVLIFSDETRDRDLKKIRDHYARLAELGEMAASLAHQIRTPLSASLLFFSNIKKSLSSSSAAYASLEKGLSGLKHIEAMIKDMLIFSKGDKKIDDCLMVADLVVDLKQDAELISRDYNCDINITDETNNTEIKVNRHAIKAAVSNLIVNSAQACQEKQKINNEEPSYKGFVNIRINNKYLNEEASIDITVEDNGTGISGDHINSVIDPFYTTRSNGTGLGLAVTKSVMDAHGGTMDISSSFMKGTIINLSIPGM